MKYLIIGSGVAGATAAETIRRLDPRGSIEILGDESGPPYCRPMISLLLEGGIQESSLAIRSEDFWEKLGISFVQGARAAGIDTEKKQVEASDGGKHYYDRLLIASGADPRPVKAENLELENIFFMRTRMHVKNMLSVLPESEKAVVLGGGLVGFKAAYGLLRRGLDVTMLISSSYPLSMQADETAGHMIRKVLENKGMKVLAGAGVKAFEGKKRVRAACLEDGTRLPCDLAVIGKGVNPSCGFIQDGQIEVNEGIRVNSRMETTAAEVYAAGDVAETFDIASRQNRVNALWPEAVSQGEAAGRNMAGSSFLYKASLSRNVIRIFDTDVMTAGLVNPDENAPGIQVLAEEDRRRGTYRKLVFRDRVLAGFVLVNRIEQGGILASLIRSRTPVEKERSRLLRPDFNFAGILPASARRPGGV